MKSRAGNETDEHFKLRHLMGPNFIGLTEAEEVFGYTWTPAEREALEAVPFSPELLGEIAEAETHVLVAVPSITIERLLRHFRRWVVRATDPSGEGVGRRWFECETVPAHWMLMAKSSAPYDRTGGSNGDGMYSLSNHYRVRPLDAIYATLMMYRARGEQLFVSETVPPSDVWETEREFRRLSLVSYPFGDRDNRLGLYMAGGHLGAMMCMYDRVGHLDIAGYIVQRFPDVE